MTSTIFDSLELSNKVVTCFKKLGGYDDPYVVCIKSKKFTDNHVQALNETVKKATETDSLYGIEGHELRADLILLLIDAEKENMSAFATELLDKITTIDEPIHISIFAHNCLGDIMETFKWSTMLLEKVIADSPNESRIGVNDFKDHQNWPGYDEYEDC